MLLINNDLSHFFQKIMTNISCRQDTKSYIEGIFTKYQTTQFDLSKSNLTILWLQATQTQNFSLYQQIADWLFFLGSINPDYFESYNRAYFDNMGRLSYYSCYKLINRQWVLFEELADKFTILENQIQHSLEINISPI